MYIRDLDNPSLYYLFDEMLKRETRAYSGNNTIDTMNR